MKSFGTPLADKLMELERSLSSERGRFILFALMLRGKSESIQDLVLSASWLNANSRESVDLIVSRLKAVLTPTEMLKLSAIVILDPNNPVVNAINTAIGVEHGGAMITNCNFFGLPVKGALIITSRRN